MKTVMKIINDLYLWRSIRSISERRFTIVGNRRGFRALVLKSPQSYAAHQTATKIKCIGECYLCASGIFDEVNQLNVHAKEIVEFGQESILCVR